MEAQVGPGTAQWGDLLWVNNHYPFDFFRSKPGKAGERAMKRAAFVSSTAAIGWMPSMRELLPTFFGPTYR